MFDVDFFMFRLLACLLFLQHSQRKAKKQQNKEFSFEWDDGLICFTVNSTERKEKRERVYIKAKGRNSHKAKNDEFRADC